MKKSDEWDKKDDWFWEGNVQNNIIDYLKSDNYSDIRSVDTESKEKGPDITAIKSKRKWIIEVKGYPSDKYVADFGQKKKGEKKSSKPSTQAGKWFSGALLSVLLKKGDNPDSEIGIGYPDFQTYISKLNRISYVRKQLGVHVFIVDENGTVTHYRPSQIVPKTG